MDELRDQFKNAPRLEAGDDLWKRIRASAVENQSDNAATRSQRGIRRGISLETSAQQGPSEKTGSRSRRRGEPGLRLGRSMPAWALSLSMLLVLGALYLIFDKLEFPHPDTDPSYQENLAWNDHVSGLSEEDENAQEIAEGAEAANLEPWESYVMTQAMAFSDLGDREIDATLWDVVFSAETETGSSELRESDPGAEPGKEDST